MRSVPPRGSGWVVDSLLSTRRYLALTLRMQAEPTRYREVVLTSYHRIESDSQPSIIMLPVKLHQYQLSAPVAGSRAPLQTEKVSSVQRHQPDVGFSGDKGEVDHTVIWGEARTADIHVLISHC